MFTKITTTAVLSTLAAQALASSHGHRHVDRSNPTTLETVVSIPEPTQEPTPAPLPDLGDHLSVRQEPPFFAKRGLAYNDATLANIFGDGCEACSWGYNWGSSRNGLDDKYNFVPMLWGDRPEFTGVWDNNVEEALNTGSKALFSFNEPDHAEQANMDPVTAAAAHAFWMNKFQGRAQIGAPAITNSGQPGQGLEWLQGFMDACNAIEGGCAVDFCNVHWYSEAQWKDTLYEHIQAAHDICGGRPIWVTEFAPVNSDGEIFSFLESVLPELDNMEMVHAYSYFMVSIGSLMFSDMDRSDFGNLYAGTL
ncbi:hypothetical protein ACO1O0_003606 [Amphichorda felina]